MKVHRNSRSSGIRQAGFSMIEVAVVCAIALVLFAMAMPQIMNMVHTYRLRNAAAEFAGLTQQARSRSVRDNNFYPVMYTDTTPITEAFIALDKSTTLNVSCSSDSNCDPMVSWAAEVQPYISTTSGIPSTSALKTLVLAGTASTGVTFLDGYSISTNPITFSPEGLPCVANTGKTICNSATTSAAESNTVVAYWIFFQDNVNSQWESVTVTPAGKVQKWAYYSGAWKQL